MKKKRNRLSIFIALLVLLVAVFIVRYFISDRHSISGTWDATWRTSPSSYAGIDAFTSFEMDGQFIFTEDSVTIVAMGFPGNVFGVDTIAHTQGWSLSEHKDTLHLITAQGVNGISYQINGRSQGVMELQLLEDIFISLEKVGR